MCWWISPYFWMSIVLRSKTWMNHCFRRIILKEKWMSQILRSKHESPSGSVAQKYEDNISTHKILPDTSNSWIQLNRNGNICRSENLTWKISETKDVDSQYTTATLSIKQCVHIHNIINTIALPLTFCISWFSQFAMIFQKSMEITYLWVLTNFALKK